MAKYEHVSIDIETFSTEPDGTIHEIAITLFNADGEMTAHQWKIDWHNQDRKFSPDTIHWWMSQPSESQKRVLSKFDRVPLKYALERLSKIINSDQYIWANSPRFDCEFLANAFRQQGMSIPWDFRKERDFRTLLYLSPVDADAEGITNTARHTALGDSQYQAKLICASLAKLRA